MRTGLELKKKKTGVKLSREPVHSDSAQKKLYDIKVDLATLQCQMSNIFWARYKINLPKVNDDYGINMCVYK